MTDTAMRYDIGLTVSYDYGAPSEHARMVVRLMPCDQPGRQRVSAQLLTVDPAPAERRQVRDFFGNAMTVLVFHAPLDRIAVSLKARVVRLARPATLDLSPGRAGLVAEVAGHRGLGPDAPAHFLAPSPRVAPDAAVAAFAGGATAGGLTALQCVAALGQAIHETMRFDAEATDVHTPLAEAFAARHGVCQDFSHIMIAGLRALGIPAGYVSGFLRTTPPPGQPRLEGADAMHAWVSAWCGAEMGWVEYDPTNACWVGQDHITIAHGRDYGDIAPVKGSLRSAGLQTGTHAVDVEPLERAG